MDNKKIHFIGIGGIGMSGIAGLFLKRGFMVSGSDIKESRATTQLKEAGAQIFIGHFTENIHGQDMVVYSSAIKTDNPEMLESNRQNIPLVKRAQALAQLMLDKTAVTVAGSHGKTTTTSLVSHMLMEAGLCPTVAIGGILKNIDTNACLGESDLFVAEADESDGSFLYYQPTFSIVTNIDREHLDFYGTFENELKAFGDFINKTNPAGVLFACYDDAHLRNMLSKYKGKCRSFGLSADADIRAERISFKGLTSEFDCLVSDKHIARFKLALGGMHNVSNSLAVIGLGLELGIDLKIIQGALLSYQGALRRLEVKFHNQRYLLLDDYAHHPSEIKATLAAIGKLDVKRRIGIFQPHRYSRTQLLLEDFAGAFDGLDMLIVTDIYPASEAPIPGVDASLLLKKIKERSPGKFAAYLPKEEIVAYIKKNMLPGDLVVTLGAGDIVKVSDALAQSLN
jgi:UDP-N-acetylmuramate--alanine ligase